MTLEYLQAAAALALVLALIGLVAMLARRFGLAGQAAIRRGSRRLSVLESLALDPKTRLVLIQRDGAEHLLAIAGTGVTVIERDLAAAPRPPAAPSAPPRPNDP